MIIETQMTGASPDQPGSGQGITERWLELRDDQTGSGRVLAMSLDIIPKLEWISSGILQYSLDSLTIGDLATLQNILGRKFCDADIHRIPVLGESVVAILENWPVRDGETFLADLKLRVLSGGLLTPAQMRGAANAFAAKGRAMVTGSTLGCGEAYANPGGPYETLEEGVQSLLKLHDTRLRTDAQNPLRASEGAKMGQDTGLGGNAPQNDTGEASDPFLGVLRGTQPDLGTYTVANRVSGDWITMRIKPDFRPAPESNGARVVDLLIGPDNELDFIGVAFITGPDSRGLSEGRIWRSVSGRRLEKVRDGLATLLTMDQEDRSQALLFYAMKSGRCWYCNRKLTVPATINAGLGTKCARKLGLYVEAVDRRDRRRRLPSPVGE